jgi:hypothetical protein
MLRRHLPNIWGAESTSVEAVTAAEAIGREKINESRIWQARWPRRRAELIWAPLCKLINGQLSKCCS